MSKAAYFCHTDKIKRSILFSSMLQLSENVFCSLFTGFQALDHLRCRPHRSVHSARMKDIISSDIRFFSISLRSLHALHVSRPFHAITNTSVIFTIPKFFVLENITFMPHGIITESGLTIDQDQCTGEDLILIVSRSQSRHMKDTAIVILVLF